MSIILDLIVAAVMIVAIILGYKRGFFKSIMHFASSIAAFFAAVFFTPYLSAYICDKFLLDRISSKIAETVGSLLNVSGDGISTETLFTDMPESFMSILTRYNIDSSVLSEQFSSAEAATADTVTAMSNAIARPVASTLSSVISFIAIFVAVLIVLKLVTFIINLAFELPILKQLNKGLGLLFGIVTAILYALILSDVMVILCDALSSFDNMAFSSATIEETMLVRLFAGVKLSMIYSAIGLMVNKTGITAVNSIN